MLEPAISPMLFWFPPKIDLGPLPNKSLPTINAPMARATKPTTNFVIFVLSVPINAIIQYLFKKLIYADFRLEKTGGQTRPIRITRKKECKFKRILVFTKAIGDI